MSEKKGNGNCIDIRKKENCCGCSACMNICEQKSISMLLDDEGFAYPQINYSLCINCGLCLTKCHMVNMIQTINYSEPYCYVAHNKDDKKSIEGSAGGIFELFCEVICGMQGVVYGASLDHEFQVRHHRASNLETAKKFRKAKYLQSEIGNTFSLAQRDLEEGRIVLFSGTPCQIGGLYSYLGKNYSNLYTIDMICNGVPSKSVFLSYLKALEEKYNSRPISICWKDKRDGWRPNKISIRFEDGKEVIEEAFNNSMQIGFMKKLYLRPSCYKCKYMEIPRIADISLGNFTEYDGGLLEQNHNKGLSMLVVSSEKGMLLFNKISKKIVFEKTDIEFYKKKNICLDKALSRNENRERFMREFKKGTDFKTLVGKFIARDCDLLNLKDYIAMSTGNESDRDKIFEHAEDKGSKIWKIISN